MSDIAIRVENLSKQCRIGGPQTRYKTIRESLTEAVQTPFRCLSSAASRCRLQRDHFESQGKLVVDYLLSGCHIVIAPSVEEEVAVRGAGYPDGVVAGERIAQGLI
jgi:hypothetical protein